MTHPDSHTSEHTGSTRGIASKANTTLATIYALAAMLGAALTLFATPLAQFLLPTGPLTVGVAGVSFLLAGCGGHWIHDRYAERTEVDDAASD